MRMIGNLLWLIIFLGFLDAIVVFLIGLLLCITIVGLPIGMGLMEYAKFLIFPFSYNMASKSDLNIDDNIFWRAFAFLIMLLYLPLGIIIFIVTIVQIILLFLSIFGIPHALVLMKSLGTLLNPVNKVCVPVDPE